MNMRARWIVIAVFFGYLAAVATGGTPNYIGAGICGGLVLVFLGVGIWDSKREDRYVLKDPPE